MQMQAISELITESAIGWTRTNWTLYNNVSNKISLCGELGPVVVQAASLRHLSAAKKHCS